jgi:proteasome lid subunit RPN8/RPN11
MLTKPPWTKHMIDPNDPAHPAHANHVISTHGRKAERIWYPETPLFEATKESLMEACGESSLERCGFIDAENDTWFIPNVHKEPTHNFYMESESVKNVLEEIYTDIGSSVLGIFHTHPNGVPWPSPRDICGWPDLRLNWRYFVVTNNEVYEWGLV